MVLMVLANILIDVHLLTKNLFDKHLKTFQAEYFMVTGCIICVNQYGLPPEAVVRCISLSYVRIYHILFIYIIYQCPLCGNMKW